MVHHCSVPDWPVNKDLLWRLKSTAGNKHPCHWISKTNAANRGCTNKPQNIFTDHGQATTTKCYSTSSGFILITVPFISRRRRTAAHLMGKENSNVWILGSLTSSSRLPVYLSITGENSGIVQRMWLHAKRGGEKENGKKERRGEGRSMREKSATQRGRTYGSHSSLR